MNNLLDIALNQASDLKNTKAKVAEVCTKVAKFWKAHHTQNWYSEDLYFLHTNPQLFTVRNMKGLTEYVDSTEFKNYFYEQDVEPLKADHVRHSMNAMTVAKFLNPMFKSDISFSEGKMLYPWLNANCKRMCAEVYSAAKKLRENELIDVAKEGFDRKRAITSDRAEKVMIDIEWEKERKAIIDKARPRRKHVESVHKWAVKHKEDHSDLYELAAALRKEYKIRPVAIEGEPLGMKEVIEQAKQIPPSSNERNSFEQAQLASQERLAKAEKRIQVMEHCMMSIFKDIDVLKVITKIVNMMEADEGFDLDEVIQRELPLD